MKRIYLVLSIILLIVSCTKTPEERMQSLYQKGMELLASNDFEEADTTFTKLSAEFPASSLGHFGLGQSLEGRQLYFDAIHAYVTIIRDDPSFSPASKAIGRAFARVGDFEEASKASTNYARLEKDDPIAHYLSARAHIANGSLEQGLLAIKKAAGLGVDESLEQICRARISFLSNQPDTAAVELSRGISKMNSNPLAYREAADFYESRHMPDSAMFFSKKSFELSKDDQYLMLDHFYRALRLNYFYEAREISDKFREQENSENFIMALDIAYYRATDESYNAVTTSDLYRQKYPYKVTALLWDIHCRWMIRESLSVFEDRRELNDMMYRFNYAPAFQSFMLGRATLEFSGYTEVIGDLEDLRKSAGLQLGQREHKLQELFLLKVLEWPDSVEIGVERLLAAHSHQPEWLMGIGDLYAGSRIRNYDRASNLFEDALSLNPMFTSAFEHWVEMEMDLKKWDKALQLMQRWPRFVELVPTSAMLKIYSLVEVDRLKEAMELSATTLPHFKDDVDLFADLIRKLRRKGHFDESKAIVEILCELNSENPDALDLVASFYFDRGNLTAAKEMVNLGLRIEEDHVGLRMQGARVEIEQGEYDKGMIILKELYDSEQGSSDVKISYSHYLARDKSQFRRAANIARKSIFYDQSSVKARLNLCYIYWQMGRFDLVKGEARKAAKIERRNPDAYFWLGQAFHKLGDPEAMSVLSKAIEFGLSGTLLVEAEATLNLPN